MVDLTLAPQIEIQFAEDEPLRRHWSNADNIRGGGPRKATGDIVSLQQPRSGIA
jgi:hypothetical protein